MDGVYKFYGVPLKISVIIPALNEENTIGKIIEEARKAKLVYEVLVVDGGSKDNTIEAAQKAGARVIKQSKKKFPGKGIAMMDGVRYARGDILVFTDADIVNFRSSFIEKLIEPILDGEADFVKGYYERKAGRVTEITAKPLLSMFFPEIKLKQPLSGEIAGKRDFFSKLKFEEGWGVDIGIVLDAFLFHAKIKEVNLGYKEHEMRPPIEITIMSKEIAQIIIGRGTKRSWWFVRSFAERLKAILNLFYLQGKEQKTKVAFFDMDGTILNGRFIDHLAKKHKLQKELSEIRAKLKQGKIREKDASRNIARLLKGMKKSEIISIASQIPFNEGVEKTIGELKNRGFKIVVLSDSYTLVANIVKHRLGADYAVANKLEVKDGILTGKIMNNKLECDERCDYSLCKLAAVNSFAKLYDVDLKRSIMVGDSYSDAHAMKAVGIRVAFKAPIKVREAANIILDGEDMLELLDYV